jgi:hypothetical protein
MLLDFEIQRAARRCAASDHPLEPGDVCYSMLEVRGADIVRTDFSEAAWAGPSDGAFAWWRLRIPEPTAKKIKLAPNDVLLELFDQLAEQAGNQDMRYVLTLLLLRRRIFRLDVADEPPASQVWQPDGIAPTGVMSVYCPKRDANYLVPIVMPDDKRVEEIQQKLSELLVAGAN